MRATIVALYALIAVPSIASADTLPRTLEASEVQAQIKPFGDDINKCYLDAARDVKGAGRLEITLSIHRTGKLDRIDVSTPGLSATLAKRISTCVKAVVSQQSFPAPARVDNGDRSVLLSPHGGAEFRPADVVLVAQGLPHVTDDEAPTVPVRRSIELLHVCPHCGSAAGKYRVLRDGWLQCLACYLASKRPA